MEYLRQLLVDSTVLAPRDESLIRLERTIELRLSTGPTRRSLGAAPVATWQVLADARRRPSVS